MGGVFLLIHVCCASHQRDIGRLCLFLIQQEERRQGIPDLLLQAVAQIESGHTLGHLRFPWPWSVNVRGKTYVFRVKHQAVFIVRKLAKRGIHNVDVGCMQINLYHHKNAFRSLEDAFDPRHNIRYGGQLLRGLYQSKGGWDKAVSYYHSGNFRRQLRYQKKVFRHWYLSQRNLF